MNLDNVSAGLEPFEALPPEAAATLRRIGPAWATDINRHRKLVVDTYTPIVARMRTHSNIVVERDLPYGPHPRQRLDIFLPKQQGQHNPGADIVIFMHGGAFIRGQKSFNGEIYDNVSYWFANEGLVAINMEYRLASDAPYPGGALDVDSAVQWARKNASQYGGNPQRIFLIGHSAGGTHVATYLLDPICSGRSQDTVSAAVLVSGRLFADVRPENPNANGVREYFGNDEALYEQRSPMTHADRASTPLMVVTAQFENPLLDQYGLEFASRVSRFTGHTPRFMQMRGHNHTSITAHFNSGENLLGREILAFMSSV
jgi:acetyl esterase/lipase